MATPPEPGPTQLARPAEPSQTTDQVARRTFLAYLAGALSAFIGLVLGLPIVGYLAAPLARKEAAVQLSLGKVAGFTPGEPKLAAVSITRQDGWRQISEARTCWVLASEDGEFTVYNGRCTHLGCAYSWRTEGRHAGSFFCPCHDGKWDQEGVVLDGPPPRPLDRLDIVKRGGQLYVNIQTT